jgi:ribonuclease HI
MIKGTPKASGQLFAESETPAARIDGAYMANIDGAARGNPGPASYGLVLRRPDGTPLESLGKYIGRHTNNVAEYYALIAALDYAVANGIKRLRVQSDSQLIVNQMKGLYKVKHPDLRPLHERAKKMAAGLEAFAIQYVPREQNREADAAANAALDNTSGVRPSFASEHDPAQKPSPKIAAGASMIGPPASAASAPRKIRARYRDGVLVPAEPLHLKEGAVVEISVALVPEQN